MPKSLEASNRDGIYHAVMLGAGENYLGVYAIFLKATTLQIGMLATLPPLLGALFQGVGVWLMERVRKRRRVMVAGAVTQAIVWLPIAGLALTTGRTAIIVTVLIALVSLYHALSGFLAPVWNSLIGDLIPHGVRGQVLGRRNYLAGMATVIALVATGVALHLLKETGHTAGGFVAVFSAAFAARLMSARWLARYSDPEYHFDAANEFSLYVFHRRARHSNCVRFVIFVSGVNFGVAFSAPYFSLFMIRDLGLSYVSFMGVTAAAAIVQFLTMQHYGQLSDRFGNKKILNVCGWGVSVVPILWVFSSQVAYLILIQTFGGLVWAGFNLATANYMFDAVTPPKRARCVAYQSMINGAFVLMGSLLGAVTALHLPDSLRIGTWVWHPVSSLIFLFLVSGMLRLLAASLFLARFREVRSVEGITHADLILRIAHLRPITGASFTIFTDVLRRGEKNG